MIESGSSKLVALLNNPIEEVVPEGWYTQREITEHTRCTASNISRMLREEVLKGHRKFKLIRITRDGVSKPVRHYYCPEILESRKTRKKGSA